MTDSDSRTYRLDLVAAIVLVIVSASAGFVVGGTTADVQASSEQASVSCISGSANTSAVCFVHGDVEFEWIGANSSTTNGTVVLSELPADNSTIRRADE